MALSDLISRPLTAPLEGFDKAVGVGFELAQKQDQLRIANEELELKREEVKSNFLSKGINALSALAKAKGPAKKAISDAAYSYFVKGGLTLDPKQWAVASSEEMLPLYPIIDQEAQSLYPNNPKLQSAYIAQKMNVDPEKYYETATEYRLKEVQLSEETQKALAVEAAKRTYESTLKGEERAAEKQTKAEEQFSKNIETYGASEELLQFLNEKTPAQRAALYNGYLSTVGKPKKFVEDNLENIKDPTPEQQKRLAAIQDDLMQASIEYADPQKRPQAISKAAKANKEFNMLLASQKSSASTAEKLFGARIAESRAKDALTESRNIQKDVSKYFDEKSTAISKSLAIISKPDATWNDIKSEIGSFARLGGTVGAQSDRDVRNALGTGFGPMVAEFSTYFDTDAEPDPSTLKRLKANAKIAIEALAKGKEEKIAGSIAALQEDPRLGTFFRPGGAQYNALSARYPQVFQSIDKKRAKSAIKSAVSSAAKSPVTVTRSEVVQKLKQKALRVDPSRVNYEPSAREIDAAFEAYKAKYGSDGVIIMKDK
jgi:hypothetical protein